MPIQTRSMVAKSYQEEETVGKWEKYWERFEVYEHLDYNGLPYDISWRDQVALFYNSATQIWSPKMVAKSFRFGSTANIMNWEKENPNFYREYAQYHKDTRNYDLENMFAVESRRDLCQLTKDELVQFLIFAKISRDCESDGNSGPTSPLDIEMSKVDQKLVRKLKRETKKKLVKCVYSYVENYNNDLFDQMWELPRGVRVFAGRSQSVDWRDDNATSIYNFSWENDRQSFIDEHYGNPEKELDVEKYEVDYKMMTDKTGQTIYFVGHGSTFHATMVHLWDCDIRLVPISTKKWPFLRKTRGINEWNYVFLKVDTVDYDRDSENHNTMGEINTKIAYWIKDGKEYKINYEDQDFFHTELIQLFNMGFYVEPDELGPISEENMNLRIMNYYGEHCESYRF